MRSAFPTLLLAAHCAHASMDTFYFAGNEGNATQQHLCGNMVFECTPPKMCTLDSATQRQFCCDPGKETGICWTGASKCGGAGTNKPSSSQLECTYQDVNYCCVLEQEKCTTVANQINICHSTFENPVASFNATKLNETFSALQASNPSAASYPVALATLLRLVNSETPTGTSSSTNMVSSTPTSSSTNMVSSSFPSATGSNLPPPKESLPRGAIGGIVGGAVGGISIAACITVWLLFRRKKTRQHERAQDPTLLYEESPYELNGIEKMDPLLKVGGEIVELSRNEKAAELEHPPVELEARETFVRVSGRGGD